MKLWCFVLLCIWTINSIGAQEEKVYERRGSGLYFEILGNGVAYSANYETRFLNQNRGIGGRIGIAYTKFDEEGHTTIPVMINYLLGKPEGKHFLELGAGVTILDNQGLRVGINDEDVFFEGNVYGTFSVMYRRHPPFGGFLFKIGWTPMVGQFSDREFLGWVGIGLGYAF